jgi:hypothetical protein
MKGTNTSTVRYPANFVNLLYQKVEKDEIPFHQWHDFCLRSLEQFNDETKNKRIHQMSSNEISKAFVHNPTTNRYPTTFFLKNSFIQTNQSPIR